METAAYCKYFELDQRHFWRASKRALILEWLSIGIGARRELRILDIGGACSITSQKMQMFGEVKIVEPNEEMIKISKKHLNLDIVRGSLPDKIDIDGNFDVVTLFDVLEHIEEVDESIKVVSGLLKPGGLLLITVPAVKWLWSDHDISLHHFRRYTKRELLNLVDKFDFEVERCSYYTSFLFPLVVTQRLLKRVLPSRAEARYDVKLPPDLINRLLTMIMKVERVSLRYVDLPIGSSLIISCKKRS